MRKSIVLVLCSSFVLSCVTTTPRRSPLDAYVRSLNYIPFDIARESDGEGTIVDYRSGYETIVASPDPPESQCFTAVQVPRDQMAVAVPEKQYAIKRGGSLGAQKGDPAVTSPLAAAFSDSRVAQVEVQLVDPFVRRMTETAVKQYLAGLPAGDVCRSALLNSKNHVISAVLGAGAVRYTFRAANDEKLKVDNLLARALNLSAEATGEYVGKESVLVERPILLGYRLWRVERLRGNEDTYRLVEVAEEERFGTP